MSINAERGGVYDPGFYTGPEWAITQTKEGGTNPALSQGKMALVTHGNDARILGTKPGSLFDYSSASPEQKAALEKELQRRHDIEVATRNRKIQQKITTVLGAAAAGGAIAALAGGAAAGAGGAAASAGGSGAAGAGTGAAAAGAGGGGLGAAGGAAGGVGGAVGMGGASGAAGGAAAGGASAASGGGLLGSMGWKDYAKMGLDAYSGYKSAAEQEKLAKDAGRPKTAMRTQTPYYNEAISRLIPYILTNLQNIFQSRMQTYGGSAAPFDIYRQLLSGVPQNYSGVGAPGNPILGR